MEGTMPLCATRSHPCKGQLLHRRARHTDMSHLPAGRAAAAAKAHAQCHDVSAVLSQSVMASGIPGEMSLTALLDICKDPPPRSMAPSLTAGNSLQKLPLVACIDVRMLDERALNVMRPLTSAMGIDDIPGSARKFIIGTMPRLRSRPVTGEAVTTECRYSRIQPDVQEPRPGELTIVDRQLHVIDEVVGQMDNSTLARMSKVDHRLMLSQSSSNWHAPCICMGVIKLTPGCALICTIATPDEVGIVASAWFVSPDDQNFSGESHEDDADLQLL